MRPSDGGATQQAATPTHQAHKFGDNAGHRVGVSHTKSLQKAKGLALLAVVLSAVCQTVNKFSD